MIFSHKKQLRNDLDEIQNILLQYGWIQGNPGSTETGFCLIGAANYYFEAIEHDANQKRIDRVKDALESIVGTVWVWNDKPGRTLDEVLILINQAIEAV